MNLGNAQPGHVFDGDYPELYERVPPRLHEVVGRQRDELNRLRADPVRRAAIAGILRGRRSGRTDLAQLALVSATGGGDALVAHGEILLTPDAYAASEVRGLLSSRGLRPAPGSYENRPDLVVRLRNPGLPATAVDQAVTDLRAYGPSARPNYVLAAAAVGKGIGGPEPVDGPQGTEPYPAVPDGSTPARVAVIDTGIPLDLRGDGWLTGVLRCDGNIDPLDALPAGPDGFLDYHAGHGNFVAGIVQQVAPGADIRVYRAIDTDGFGTDAEVAAAMIRAFEQGAQVINLSLGTETLDGAPPPAMRAAVETIRAAEGGGDVVIVAAAGNSGGDVPSWPGALDGVIAVGGLTNGLDPADWSTRGDWVRFSTIGEGIRSTFVPGQESPVFDPDPDTFPDNAWAIWTGTSFAAPQITGAIARLCQELAISPQDAVQELDKLGMPVDGFGSAMRVLPGLG
jgi:thermitase